MKVLKSPKQPKEKQNNINDTYNKIQTMKEKTRN